MTNKWTKQTAFIPLFFGGRDGSVGIVTWLQAQRPSNRTYSLGRDKRLSLGPSNRPIWCVPV